MELKGSLADRGSHPNPNTHRPYGNFLVLAYLSSVSVLAGWLFRLDLQPSIMASEQARASSM